MPNFRPARSSATENELSNSTSITIIEHSAIVCPCLVVNRSYKVPESVIAIGIQVLVQCLILLRSSRAQVKNLADQLRVHSEERLLVGLAAKALSETETVPAKQQAEGP